MICKYQKFILNDSAREYFIRTLEYGHELDKQLLKKINSFKGNIYTYLPRKPSFSDSYQFEGGGVAKSSSSVECIICEISEYIDNKSGNICVFEDALCTPEDQFSDESIEALLSFNDEVYFCIDKNTRNENIKNILLEAEQPNFFVCVLSSKPSSDFPVLGNKLLSSVEIINIAERTEKVILGAYDGEGYLIWEKFPSRVDL
ncbi:hypothetical protein C4565_09735 [Candidatus Parcubacteria bacterium]|nr:MAG: hypothetical protein C4565_09735 [Candidatus Parcubacteria bacterium]